MAILLLTLCAASALAQNPASEPSDQPVVRLELADGSELIGHILEDSDPVSFRLLSGAMIEIDRVNIREMVQVEGTVREGRFRRRDPSSNRLFFGPTGRTIGQGHGYVAVFEAVFPSVSVGLHDRFTMGGGTLLIGPLVDDRPFWLLPKLQILDIDNLALSVGALAATAGGDWAGILYGVGTLGDEDGSFTLGVGYGWVGDELLDIPIFQVGGDVRVADNLKLMTENYFISDDYGFTGLFGGGVRFIGDRLTADLGVGIPSEEAILVPLVNFVWNW